MFRAVLLIRKCFLPFVRFLSDRSTSSVVEAQAIATVAPRGWDSENMKLRRMSLFCELYLSYSLPFVRIKC